MNDEMRQGNVIDDWEITCKEGILSRKSVENGGTYSIICRPHGLQHLRRSCRSASSLGVREFDSTFPKRFAPCLVVKKEYASINVLDVGEWPTVPHRCTISCVRVVSGRKFGTPTDVGFKRRPHGLEISARIGHRARKRVNTVHYWPEPFSATREGWMQDRTTAF